MKTGVKNTEKQIKDGKLKKELGGGKTNIPHFIASFRTALPMSPPQIILVFFLFLKLALAIEAQLCSTISSAVRTDGILS
jgi:hypothetical protein